MIAFNHISKSFGKKEVLNDLSVEFKEPGISMILGPNASGKTTLIKCLMGMVIPSEGEVLFDGKTTKNQVSYRSRISYLPQIAQFPDNLQVKEILRFIQQLQTGKNRLSELIDLFGLEDHLNQKLGQLSGGTRQKTNLCLALMFDNPVLILDEPTNGLDPVTLLRLKEFIRNERDRGKIILITTHIMGLVEALADRIVFILDGNIYFDGTMEELNSQQERPDVEQSIAHILERSHV